MTRYIFGGDFQALLVDSAGNVQAGATLTAWDSETDGTQYVDLTDELGTALPSGDIQTDVNGYAKFYGPDGIKQVWIQPPTGPRRKLLTADLVTLIQDAQDRADAAFGKGVPTNATPDLILGHDGSVPLWRTLAAAGIVGINDGALMGEDGRKYRLLSGTIRNSGSGWEFIDDSAHQPSGFDTTLVVDSDSITLNYLESALKVSSLQVTPDETFAAMGLRVGASVGTDSTVLSLYLQPSDRISDRVFYNGTTWVSEHGVFTGLSYASSVLTLTHESMGTGTGSGVAIANRGTSGAFGGTLTDTTTPIAFYSGSFESLTGSGAANSAKHNCYVTRFGQRDPANIPAEDPATVVSTFGNLWITGLMEVA